MDQIVRLLAALQNRIERIEKGLIIKKITVPSDGYFVPKVVSSDPISPQTNEVWINSTSSQLKWYTGATTKAVTLT